MSGITRRRKWAIIVAATLLGLAAVIGVLAWAIHRPEFRDALSHRVDDYLKQQLGAGASVRDVQIGWSSVTIFDLIAPLDSNGSQISIAEAHVSLNPSDLLRSLHQPQRIVKGVQAQGVTVLIAEAKHRAPSPNAGRSYSSFKLPPGFYDILQEFGSLQVVSATDVSLQYSSRDSCWTLLQGVSLEINRELSGLRISGTGSYLNDPSATFSLTGILQPDNHGGELSLVAAIPSGALPMFESAPISTSGGKVSLRMALDDTLVTLMATAALDSVVVRAQREEFSAPRLRVATFGDTLRLDPLDISSSFGRLRIAGDFDARSQTLMLSGHVRLEGLPVQAPDSVSSASPIDSVEADVAICGTLVEPVVTISAPLMRISGQEIRSVVCEATVESHELHVHSLSAQHGYGSLDAHGTLALDSTLAWHAMGRFTPDSVVASREWKTRVGAVDFDASGHSRSVAATVELLARDQQRLGEGRVSRADSSWNLVFVHPDGRQAGAIISLGSGQTRASATNAHVILSALLDDPNHMLDALETLSLSFAGNSKSGTLELESSLRADSTTLLPKILQDVKFNGSYDRQPDSSMAILGQWSGMNGEGQPFEGSADLSLLNSRIDIHHVFIDQASTAAGFIDLAANNLDLEINVVDLPFDKMPLRPEFARRAQVAGSTTGRVHVAGDLKAPEWTARLAVVDGAVLGVPGYWINLDADGRGLAINLHQFELGRDIRRIVLAQGMIDLGQNQIAITAETGSGRAEDFVTALLGRTGIVSGALDGRAAISGQLKRPDVEAEFTINDGFLFKEVYFSELTASAQVHVGADGFAMVNLPEFRFNKDSTYAFTAQGNAALTQNGPLSFHVEGRGDFLNILDQMDREFAGYGSQGTLSVDIGGSVDHPRFTDGSLALHDGRFTFPSATPATIGANLEFQADGNGVESGSIELEDGDQSLSLTVRSDWATAYPDLKPLVIPTPRLTLGVLELRTNSHGMPVRIPGLMKPEWLGQVTTGADSYTPILISAENDTSLRISGDVELRNARVTFPFTGGGTASGRVRPVTKWLLERLTEAEWNLNVFVGQGDHYDVEITGLKNSELFATLRESPVFSTLADYFDHLNVDAVIEPSETPVAIRGTVADSTFRLDGRFTSLRGRVEYLDQRFTITTAICDFDETDIMPVLEGRASTTGTDSLGRRLPVYLTMYVIDRETQIRQRRGRLDDLTFVMEDDAGDPPEAVIALLGYDVGSVSGKAQELVTSSVVRAIGRQWIDPIERRLEKWTPLDEVTLNPAGGRTTLARQQKQHATQTDKQLQSSGAIRFFTGSQLTVGKYLTNDVFLTYTGELAESQSAPETGRLSLVHIWNLEYRIKPVSPDLLLDFAVEYDEFERRRDESVSLKYSFALEP